MWKVGDERTMSVGCNPESNFPISIELKFGGRLGSDERLANSHGMWFGIEDAQRLILQLEKAIEIVRAAEQAGAADSSKAWRKVTTLTDDDFEAISKI